MSIQKWHQLAKEKSVIDQQKKTFAKNLEWTK